MVFLVLYLDDILLTGNYVRAMTTTKVSLAKQFDIIDLGEAKHVLGV